MNQKEPSFKHMFWKTVLFLYVHKMAAQGKRPFKL